MHVWTQNSRAVQGDSRRDLNHNSLYVCAHKHLSTTEWGMLNITEAAERETLKVRLTLHYVVRHRTQLPNLRSRVGSVPVGVSPVARCIPVQTRRSSYNVWRGRRRGLYRLWDILMCGMEHVNTAYNVRGSRQTQTKWKCTYIIMHALARTVCDCCF